MYPINAFALAALLCNINISLANPVRRSAAVIPISGQRTHQTRSGKTVDLDEMHKYVEGLRAKHGKNLKRKRAPSSGSPLQKRSNAVHLEEPYDVGKRWGGVHPRGTAFVTLPLDDVQDSAYFGSIQIGTPAQTTTVQIDTGSSDLVVPISGCRGSCSPPLISPSDSSTFKASSTPFTIQYGDGSGATGSLASDNVVLAGLGVSDQTFAAVNFETQGFSGPFAGVMGFAFPADAASRATPWIWNLANSGQLWSNVFSLYLARNNNTGSELCVGCIDSTKFTGNITYFPIDTTLTQGINALWTIASNGFSVNGASATPGFTAIIDSGTTLVLAETAITDALFSQLPGFTKTQQSQEFYYTAPCSSFSSSVGEIGVNFGGQTFGFNAEDLLFGEMRGNGGTCIAAIVGDDSGLSGSNILGDVFMKNWYTVFDMQNTQVGLAKSI